VEQSTSTPKKGFLQELQQRRAELRDSMSALEHALATPAVGRAGWAERVHVALVELSADLREHVRITEGPDGLYTELLEAAPRLSAAMDQLAKEHAVMGETMGDLLNQVTPPDAGTDVERVRELGTRLLGTLARHRQRGADLVYEAYEFDIGGDT
jgi:hypothetical protein